MPTGNDKFNAAANEAGCNFLLAAGAAATQFAAYSLLTGSVATGAAGAAVAGISAWAYASNCQYDADAALPPVSGNVGLKGCVQVELNCAGSYDLVQFSSDGTYKRTVTGNSPYVSINAVEKVDDNTARINLTHFNLPAAWITIDGVADGDLFGFSGVPDGCCIKSQPTGPITPPPPYVYTDPDDGCQINVSFQGWGVDGSGTYSPVWQMDPILPPARAGGGVIGGCNFNPVVVYQPPGPPTIPPIPVTPSPAPGPGGRPWWVDAIREVIGGVISNIVASEIAKYLEPELPEFSKEIRAACEFDADGNYETFTVNFPVQKYGDRMLSWQDAQVDFMQQLFLWKTPVCSASPMPITGEPVSINFISEQPSASTGNYLRKLFTYFDQSGRSLAQHVEHWRNFVWEAGPSIVSVNNTKLGKPQVWAASNAEGQRVINHAAAIAGVDMTDAEWLFMTPRSSRYGQTGVMRVHRSVDGLLGVTKRDGPSGFPPALP